MVQISDESKEGDNNGKEIVEVRKTFLTYKRQPRNPSGQGSQMSPELQKSSIYTLSNSNDFHKEVQENGTAIYMSTVTFGDEDMYAETPDHNRPLFITGFVLNTEISQVMVDEGCSNNEAEYEAVIVGLELALQIPIEDLSVYEDSELVIK
ncbi:hypothetical protein Vadar_029033 [Vaccinium darrowii]|uniref:Uncharacterized protein n=1 Tax=Vaccinium darrowii TaxID=229202 RepID=A0ACB7YH96_9ERIC|nr:hypothetical protein Vadar_029033 [Vaccinium darrowii]